MMYKADNAQMKTGKAGNNKGVSLKIGKDHALVDFHEKKIRDEKY